MTVTVAIAASVLVVGLLWLILRGQSADVVSADDLIGRVRMVDLEAFRNLINPAQDRFLRTHLPARLFKRVQRKRNRAALEYVSWVGQNSAILLRLGEAARRSSNREVSRAGEELVSLAIQTRGYVLLASIVLWIGVILPRTGPSLGRLVHSYERLRTCLDTLVRMQQPTTAARVVSLL